jgi:malonate decarboxylase gamma subunit
LISPKKSGGPAVTLDSILASLFPRGHDVRGKGGLLFGSGQLDDGRRIDVIGVSDRTPVGVDEAIRLARYVRDVVARGDDSAILVLVDSDSQRMSKRDELLGLSEFLAHLAKMLMFADKQGHRTVSLLYGHSAAGAFIATALSTRTLVALPSASPAVMDLPSMSKVTKLPLDVLTEKAKSTPVFAPGVDNVSRMGAVSAIWDENASLADQLKTLLDDRDNGTDRRDALGKTRLGRPKASDIAERVRMLALQQA